MIILDVGSHNGQTLEELVEHDFERIHSFEPMPGQRDQLIEKFGGYPQVTLWPFGLLDESGTFPVYGSNTICEASIYPTKVDLDRNIVTECSFVEASEWFRAQIPEGETVLVKMNCEGAEIPILNNLIDSGEIWKITAMTFDLDIRRCAGLEHQADELLERLRTIGFDRYQISGDAFHGNTHREKIANWLASCS